MNKLQILSSITDRINQCNACPLSEKEWKRVPGEGNADAKIVFVGEAPGAAEQETGRPFVGRAGKLLTNMIKAMNCTREDVYIVNVCKCRPPQNRKPTSDEMKSCEPFLKEQLAVIQPKVIITLGATATEALLGVGLGITKRRGIWEEYEGVKVMPTFHPAACLYNPNLKDDVWKDLQEVIKFLKE